MGAIALVTTLGVAIPAGAVASHTATGHVTLTSHAAKTKKVTKIKHVAFKGTYTGTIALLWSSTGVTATSVAGHGTGTYGANTMKGSGSGSAANTCNPFDGSGNLVGPSGLKLKVATSTKTQACAVNAAAPTPVTVIGVAKIMSGTGKFKGASGTLSFKGSFSIQSATAGSSENDTFNATISGVVTIKTVTTVTVK
ncbi:MAG: hypothetical protein ACLPKZ_01585 [Acidimicrobiales bacterium]